MITPSSVPARPSNNEDGAPVTLDLLAFCSLAVLAAAPAEVVGRAYIRFVGVPSVPSRETDPRDLKRHGLVGKPRKHGSM